MTDSKYNDRTYGLLKVYDLIKDDLNAELKAKGFREMSPRRFKRIIKHYFKHIYNRVVYKYQSVELYDRFGTVLGHKILCTEFNPKNIDVNATDGYYYFIFWQRPKAYRRWKFFPAPIWKKRIFQNVRDNGGDYPEINEMTYGIHK